ncbi:MAG: universal stress protein [Gammaproteobacteria bacterium]|nr:universal stress protein [Gammaproteobacteria bacterium]
MATNISMIYGGTEAETGALNFTALLAAGLDLGAECRYIRDALGTLTSDQRENYRNLIELGGWSQAQEYLSDTAQARLVECSKQAEAAFHRTPSSAHIAWRGAFNLASPIAKALSELGFTRDLIVASFALPSGVQDALLRQVLLVAGAPLAVIHAPPRKSTLDEMGVVLAWKPSAAATHALRYALPLLRKVARVHLVTIEEPGAPKLEPSAKTLADTLLEVHRVTIEPHVLRAADDPAAQLADFYRDIGADLLVMGAYSQSRLQEMLFGGFTKYFLTKPRCNLLLAH